MSNPILQKISEIFFSLCWSRTTTACTVESASLIIFSLALLVFGLLAIIIGRIKIGWKAEWSGSWAFSCCWERV